MLYQKAMTLSVWSLIVLPPAPRVLCAYSKGYNREPTQLDNWKAPKYAWSLSKISEDRSYNERFFSVWLFHVFWLVMLILSEGTIKAGLFSDYTLVPIMEVLYVYIRAMTAEQRVR
jgi:hypothetical protein